MPVGKSGRIVIEIDPDLKQELYRSLEYDESSLKEWFLTQVKSYLSGTSQLAIDFDAVNSIESIKSVEV